MLRRTSRGISCSSVIWRIVCCCRKSCHAHCTMIFVIAGTLLAEADHWAHFPLSERILSEFIIARTQTQGVFLLSASILHSRARGPHRTSGCDHDIRHPSLFRDVSKPPKYTLLLPLLLLEFLLMHFSRIIEWCYFIKAVSQHPSCLTLLNWDKSHPHTAHTMCNLTEYWQYIITVYIRYCRTAVSSPWSRLLHDFAWVCTASSNSDPTQTGPRPRPGYVNISISTALRQHLIHLPE